MSEVSENLRSVLSSLPEGVTLAAVSKFHSEQKIMEAYYAGQRIFAESRPLEFEEKFRHLPKDIVWHFIGHLQRNKVKNVVGKASLIQSVDSLRLLDEIDAQSLRLGTVSDVLLEIHVAEQTKQGFEPDELETVLSIPRANVRICGLMAMATFTDDISRIRSEFTAVRSLRDRYLPGSVLSMGMSNDYPVAIECGATLVRVGSRIFGSRI